MVIKRKIILLITALMLGILICACGKEKESLGESYIEDTGQAGTKEDTKIAQEEAAEQLKKGYNLQVDGRESEEAEADCKKMMELYFDIYENAYKGKSSNVVLSNEMIRKIQDKVKETGCPVSTLVTYSNMENYEIVDKFLKECGEGKSGSTVVYEIQSDGGLDNM